MIRLSPILLRRTVVAAVLFFALVTVASAAPLTLTLDRADGCYRAGDPANVTVEVDPALLDRAWKGTLHLEREWSGEKETREFSVSEKPVVLTVREENPAQVVVTVLIQLVDEPATEHRASIGMLFAPEEMSLPTEEPDDFDEFWRQQKQEWRKIPRRVELRPVESPAEGIVCWDLTIHQEGTVPVSGYLARPEKMPEGGLPTVLLVHGAGVRSSSLGGAARQAAMGFLALDINAHGLPNGEPASFYEEQNGGPLRDYRVRGMESRETWYFREMFLRLVTALDFLCERAEWNGKDVMVRGSSQGGAQALAAAGLDPRVTAFAASVPAMCDLSGEVAGRKGGWPQPLQRADDEAARAAVAETVRYYDCGIFARKTEAAAIVSLGLVDPVCPANGVQAAVNNLRGTKELLYRPAMAHAIPADIQQAFDEFLLRQARAVAE